MRKREPGRRTSGAALALAVASGAMVLVLGGCGQFGPLYLPKKPPPSAVAPAPASASVLPSVAGRAGAIRAGRPGPFRARLNLPAP